MLHKNVLKLFTLLFFFCFQSFSYISNEELEQEYVLLIGKYRKQPIEDSSPEIRALTEMYDKASVLYMVGNEDYLRYVQFIAKERGSNLQELLAGIYE